MDIVQRLQRRPGHAQSSRMLDCLDAADEILHLRAELAAAEARGIAIGRAQMREEAAQIAEWSHMALPDGGSPTVEEREVAEEAARRIRALPMKQHVAFAAESKADQSTLPHDPIKGDEGRGG